MSVRVDDPGLLFLVGIERVFPVCPFLPRADCLAAGYWESATRNWVPDQVWDCDDGHRRIVHRMMNHYSDHGGVHKSWNFVSRPYRRHVLGYVEVLFRQVLG